MKEDQCESLLGVGMHFGHKLGNRMLDLDAHIASRYENSNSFTLVE